MYKKISGPFEADGSSPVSFLPGFRLDCRDGVIGIAKAPSLTGTPWPAGGRLRRILEAVIEKNIDFLTKMFPDAASHREGVNQLMMEIHVAALQKDLRWGFEFDTGLLKIFDNRGMEIAFTGEREQNSFFMFRGRGIRQCVIVNGNWRLEENNGVFCCFADTVRNQEFVRTEEKAWEHCAGKKYAWWHEAFLLTRHLTDLEESRRQELLICVQQLLMYPEDSFYFDGNFSSWCSGMRKLRFSELLKAKLLKICRAAPVWNYNAKCYTGIDDGIRLPRCCDFQGNPLDLDWLTALDSSYSALTAVEMFEYCNTMHDLEFLKEYAFDFMTQVMQVIELSIEPENFKLALPCSPLPGGKTDSIGCCGKNVDRQLFFIHALAERLIKACGMIGRRPDPVWHDIIERLPRARGSWFLAPDTSWGKAGKKICDMMN